MQCIQANIDIAGEQIRHQILVHRLLENQMPHAFSEGAQLPLQHIREDTGQIFLRVFRIQVAGIESDTLLNEFALAFAVILFEVSLHLYYSLWRDPEGKFLFSDNHALNPPFFRRIALNFLVIRGFCAGRTP